MKLLILHDINSPDRVIPLDSDEFAMARPYLSGSEVKLKDSDDWSRVHETPEEILKQLQDLS